MRILSTMVLSLCVSFPGQLVGAELPPEIVGVWATPESEFDRSFNLLGGLVLYVAPSGVAAVAGAPLPVKRNAAGQVYRSLIGVGGSATYDASTGRLTITLRDGNKSRIVVAEYKASERALFIGLEASKLTQLSRRSPMVPIALESTLAPAASNPSVDRRRDP
jgi:hypothetical protein